MNNIVKSTLLISILSLNVNATDWNLGNDLNDDINKMDKYISSMINSHIKNNTLINGVYPKLNMRDMEDKYILEFNVAGLEKEDIKLLIDQNNILILEGEKKSEIKNKLDSLIKEEIVYKKFKRAVQLPENIDQSKFDTQYKNGILSIVIHKKESDKPKYKIIEIK